MAFRPPEVIANVMISNRVSRYLHIQVVGYLSIRILAKWVMPNVKANANACFVM
jgi:hypothetical protein